MDKTRKIVFLDIDGTLASRFNYVPVSARKACRTARENGHILYIASGRSRWQIADSILEVGFDGVISSAGARIEKDGSAVFNAFLPAPLIDRLLAFLNEKNAPYVLETPEIMIADMQYFSLLEESGVNRNFIQFLAKQYAPLSTNFDRTRVSKLVFIENGDFHFENIEQEFRAECEIFRNSIPVFTGGGGEITPFGVNKGTALEKVREIYGIRREDTIAFGDGDNDRPLLAAAGIGIAMGNADESLKQNADYVAGDVRRNGLAKAFHKYGLA